MITQPDTRIMLIAQKIGELFGDNAFRGKEVAEATDALHATWAETNCTPDDKKAVFNALYGPEALKEIEAAASTTIAEIQMMLVECDIQSITITR